MKRAYARDFDPKIYHYCYHEQKYTLWSTEGICQWLEHLLDLCKEGKVIKVLNIKQRRDGYLNHLVILPKEKYQTEPKVIFIETRNNTREYIPDEDFYIRIYFPAGTMNKSKVEYRFMDLFGGFTVIGKRDKRLFYKEIKDGDERDPWLVKMISLLTEEFCIKGFGFSKNQVANDGVQFDYDKFVSGELDKNTPE